MNLQFANYFWENLLIAMIGDQFPPEAQVNGLLCSVTPKQQKIEVWLGNRKEGVSELIEKLREVLNLPKEINISFRAFASDDSDQQQ